MSTPSHGHAAFRWWVCQLADRRVAKADVCCAVCGGSCLPLPWDCVGLHVCVMHNNDWLAAAAIASDFCLNLS